MGSLWSWIKKHWRWILFPVSIIGSILGWYLWWLGREKRSGKVFVDVDIDHALNDLARAQDERERALVELEKQYLGKLATMSNEDWQTYKSMRQKPIEEIAAWIDKL